MAASDIPARVRAAVPEVWRDRASPAVEYVAAPLATRRRLRPFVIVCGPRTGSELLRELLDSLPDVTCEGELLQRAPRLPLAYLNGRAVLGGRGRAAWGCKILDSHLHLGLTRSRPPGERLLPDLAARGWTIVNLRRRDLLAQALSYAHAMQGQWHFRELSSFAPFEADTAAIIALLHVLDGNGRWLDDKLSEVPHTTVSYEEDLRPPERRDATLAHLADVLGVEHGAGSTELRAVAPERPEQRITNFDELARALEHTRFADLVTGRARDQPPV